MSLGASIAVACTLSASYVPRTCFPLFALLVSGGLGICNGLSYSVPIRLGWKAIPERSGLVSGLIIGGFGFGSLLFTYMATQIVNPNNLSQISSINEAGEDISVFPEAVATMVPVLMRWLALSFTILVSIALFLITEPITEEESDFTHLQQ